MVALSDATVRAIEQALGNYSLTDSDIIDPDATAEEIMEQFADIAGTPGWEDELTFNTDDLAEYIRRQAEEAK